MNAKSTILSTAFAVTLSVIMVACSADAPATTPTAASAASAAKPTVEASEVAPEPAAVGEVVTAEQAEALPAGQRTYPMADGSLVVIDDAAPLPEAVRAEMIAPMLALNAQFKPLDGSNAADQAESNLRAAISDEIAAAGAYGRDFYFVVFFEADAGTFYVALTRDGKAVANGVQSKDEAIRTAQEQADRINNAERRLGEFIEVIVP